MQGHVVDFAAAAAAFSDVFPSAAPMRALVFADMFGASQAIAFVEGLAGARAGGRAAVRIVEEQALGADAAARAGIAAAETIAAQFEAVRPTVVVLSRFGLGGAYDEIRLAASAAAIPVLVHMDDDLIDLPVVTGIERYRQARHPRRLHTLARALREADLVIAATEALAERLTRHCGHARIGWMENGTAGAPQPKRQARPAGAPLVIGYMGSASHGPDLELAAPALTAVADALPDVRLELFGSIARQGAADLLPSRTVRHDPVAGGYGAFKRRLAELQWDIGLAPLRDTPYNRCKTATKWAEYAEAGMAVAASDVEIYRPMFDAGAAAAASPAQWTHVLMTLASRPDLRAELVREADRLLAARYGWDRLEASVSGLLGRGALAAEAA